MLTNLKNNIFDKVLSAKFWERALKARFGEPAIQSPKNISHSNWTKYIGDNFNKQNYNVLEIGSRVVTGANFRKWFSSANYIGFDFYKGDNVDVVGDVHKLSSYFTDKKFDLIFSTACFEHFYMPWIVAEEIQKLLKVGGHVFVETHFSFSFHEAPWNFFQFSDMGLRALFNPALGFKVIESGMSNPMYGFFGERADPYLQFRQVNELYCHSEIFCQKTRDVIDFSWHNVSMDEVVSDTRYPLPKHGSS